MKRLFFLTILTILLKPPGLGAQEEKIVTPQNHDSTLLPLRITVFARSFFMTTINRGDLTDYYAWANGVGLKAETGVWKHFQIGARVYGILNTASSDLTARDPITQMGNRYEVGLFDLNDPAKKTVARLEEFYLRYHFRKGRVTLGRQILNTPFLNIQDGRMQPTAESGLWTSWKPDPHWELQGGWIGWISPRSTSEFFPVAKTIGMYGQGVDLNGEKANFYGNLENNGLWTAGITWKKGENLTIQAWDYFAGNIFNTAFLQADARIPLGQNRISLGFQLTRQDDLNSEGEVNTSYFVPGSSSLVLGGRAGFQWQGWQWNLNYNRITGQGRFLFPREWGREPFYTFIPRERNEGYADVNAYTISAIYRHPENKMSVWAAFGIFQLPDVKDYPKNKYGMPSYNHLYLDFNYPLKKLVKGLEIRLIYAYKGSLGETYENPKYEINKVDMHHFNLILNYNWSNR